MYDNIVQFPSPKNIEKKKNEITYRRKKRFVFLYFLYTASLFMAIRLISVIYGFWFLEIENYEIQTISFNAHDFSKVNLSIRLKNQYSPTNLTFDETDLEMRSLDAQGNEYSMFHIKTPKFTLEKNKYMNFKGQIEITDVNKENIFFSLRHTNFCIIARINCIPRLCYIKIPISKKWKVKLRLPVSTGMPTFKFDEINIAETDIGTKIEIRLDPLSFNIPSWIDVSYDDIIFYFKKKDFEFEARFISFIIKNGKFIRSPVITVYYEHKKASVLREDFIKILLKKEVTLKLIKYEIRSATRANYRSKHLNFSLGFYMKHPENVDFEILSRNYVSNNHVEIKYIFKEVENYNGKIGYALYITKNTIPFISDHTKIYFSSPASVHANISLNNYDCFQLNIIPTNSFRKHEHIIIHCFLDRLESKVPYSAKPLASDVLISLEIYGKGWMTTFCENISIEFSISGGFKLIHQKKTLLTTTNPCEKNSKDCKCGNSPILVSHKLENLKDSNKVLINSEVNFKNKNSSMLEKCWEFIIPRITFILEFRGAEFIISLKEGSVYIPKQVSEFNGEIRCLKFKSLLSLKPDMNKNGLIESIFGDGSYNVKTKDGHLLFKGELDLNGNGNSSTVMANHKIKHYESNSVGNHRFEVLFVDKALDLSKYRIMNTFIFPEVNLLLKPCISDILGYKKPYTTCIKFSNVELKHVVNKSQSTFGAKDRLMIEIFLRKPVEIGHILSSGFEFAPPREKDAISTYVAVVFNILLRSKKVLPTVVENMINVNVQFEEKIKRNSKNIPMFTGSTTVDIPANIINSAKWRIEIPKISFNITDKSVGGPCYSRSEDGTIFYIKFEISEHFDTGGIGYYRLNVFYDIIGEVIPQKNLQMELIIGESHKTRNIFSKKVVKCFESIKANFIVASSSNIKEPYTTQLKIKPNYKSVVKHSFKNTYYCRSKILFRSEALINILKRKLPILFTKLGFSRVPSGMILSVDFTKVISFDISSSLNNVSSTHISFSIPKLELKNKIIVFEETDEIINKRRESEQKYYALEKKDVDNEDNFFFDAEIEGKFPESINLNLKTVILKAPFVEVFSHILKFDNTYVKDCVNFNSKESDNKKQIILPTVNSININFPSFLSLELKPDLKLFVYYSKSGNSKETQHLIYEADLAPSDSSKDNLIVFNHAVHLCNSIFMILRNFIFKMKWKKLDSSFGVAKFVLRDKDNNVILVINKKLYNFPLSPLNIVKMSSASFFELIKKSPLSLIRKIPEYISDFFDYLVSKIKNKTWR